MPTPPPSYTRIPLEQRKYTSIETEARLRRFLIDSVVYAYKVDTDALFKALPSGMATALSASDRDDFLELAEIINDASNNVVRNQISLISLDTISNISDHAIVPSRKLGVDPSCILCLLRMFSQHQGIYRHKVGFYIGQYRIIPDNSFRGTI